MYSLVGHKQGVDSCPVNQIAFATEAPWKCNTTDNVEISRLASAGKMYSKRV